MQRLRVAKTLILFIVLYLIDSPLSHSQMRNPTVRIKLDTENEYQDKTRIFTNLYTIINGRQYFIGRLERVALGLHDPVRVDPTGRYVFYESNTGCGFAQGGMTIFESDVYGKKKGPILGSCMYLSAERFLSFQGKNYLLITQSSEALENSFWLYDISRREFVLHAEGEIREIKKGIFSYGYRYQSEFKPLGTITMRTLIGRQPPLRLLPRYPTHVVTQKRDVQVYPSVLGCDIDSDKPHMTITKRGTRAVILEACEDGGYEIYYDGLRGKVMKGSVRTVKLGPRK
jgi:hypothetical protein